MHKYLVAAVAVTALTSPALARDGSPYVGVGAGLILDGEARMDLDVRSGNQEFAFDDAAKINVGRGADLDLVAGYDLGMFRAEAELGYKRLNVKNVDFAGGFISNNLDDAFDRDQSGTVWSLMGNALLDFGGNEGPGVFFGGGVGAARGKFEGESGTALAWQLLAGAYMPISSNVELGLKYRLFNSQKLEYSGSVSGGNLGVFDIDAQGKLRTHSLLGSLIFNFGSPASAPVAVAAPPPPPPPPTTQTCPDGSVILTTDMCPMAPPPPPPPAPAGERG
jgi:opacity protein-like surface antigen